VSVIDAKTYKVTKTLIHLFYPNSLALSADGKTLYVTVKQKSTCQQEATQPDDVILYQSCDAREGRRSVKRY
jgi:sugar lactone lactonase YvrE